MTDALVIIVILALFVVVDTPAFLIARQVRRVVGLGRLHTPRWDVGDDPTGRKVVAVPRSGRLDPTHRNRHRGRRRMAPT